jgi:hypothetical protein
MLLLGRVAERRLALIHLENTIAGDRDIVWSWNFPIGIGHT